MFTGLIECMGVVRRVEPDPHVRGVSLIEIEAPRIAREIAVGDSVAVSGACLTATSTSGVSFSAQMMIETARATKLGSLEPGSKVNVERALRAGGRLDGHIVQGHVDGVGTIRRIESQGDASGSKKIFISTDGTRSWGIAPKGSICIDGVSLTVIDSSPDGLFSVGSIPLTMRETTIGLLSPGDLVNIEIDVIARYIANILRFREERVSSQGGGLTWDRLREYGWS